MSLSVGIPAKTAAARLASNVFASATAAGVAPSGVTVTTTTNGTAVDLTVTAPTAGTAEQTAQACVDATTGQVQSVVGPFTLTDLGPPAAVATGSTAGAVVGAAATAGFVLALLTALAVRTAVCVAWIPRRHRST